MNSRINEVAVRTAAVSEPIADDVTEKGAGIAVEPWNSGTSRPAAAPRLEPADAWQTPGYTVIETALEVTAYALANR